MLSRWTRNGQLKEEVILGSLSALGSWTTIPDNVVELLIRKLEIEPKFSRRVDIFFLVDSITQCPHTKKGIAGASYIPTVQAALPRLLGAADPSGSGTSENRRQCLKVLRLWLERKIMLEPVLRHYMDDIMPPEEKMTAGTSLRRPSWDESSIDDPLREMDDMLVDEYGSNLLLLQIEEEIMDLEDAPFA